MWNEKTALSPARRRYLQQQKSRRRRTLALQWSLLLVLLVLWELLGRVGVLDSFVVSSPLRILKTLGRMAANQLPLHIATTVYETLVGFSLGALAGLLLATLLWWSPFLGRLFEPYLVVLNALPKIALGPVIIILAGAGTRAIIVMALAISLIVTVMEMLSGFLHTDENLIKMAQTFGATRRQLYCHIVFPANLHTLFHSLKVNIGLSLVGVIAGEFLVSKAGLGYLIVYGGQVFQMDLVMTSVQILAAVAALMYQAVRLAQWLCGKYVCHESE